MTDHENNNTDAGAASSTKVALIVEDDPTFQSSLRQCVSQLGDNWQVAVCSNGAQVIEVLTSQLPHIAIALVDLGLPDRSGIEIIDWIRSRAPNIPILVVSVISSERSVLAAIRAGARGYLLKDDNPQLITQSLAEALQGNYPISPSLARYLFRLAGGSESTAEFTSLTPKELELLRHLSRGRSYGETAQEMGIAISTVQTHIRNLYRKLDVHSQVQAVTKAQDQGLI
jgi:two-component system nitrate/nitrite response regulator NarL